MGIGSKIKTAATAKAINTALGYLEKDPVNNVMKIIDLVDKVSPGNWYAGQRKAMREAMSDPDSNWYKLMLKVYSLDPGVRKAFFTNFITNASLKGSARQHEVQEKEGCNVPWAVLMDPTSACNLHCTGCWAAEYGHKLNLTYEDLDSIVNQANDLGCYMFIYTGGEPLVRKKDLIRLCEAHPDSEFLSFTNGTLIDEEFCQDMLRVKNFVPAMSLEGFEEANDGRRGDGVYNKVMHAMDLLNEHHLAYGLSVCYTKKNCADVTSDEFIQKVIDKGALFIWFFHFMPVGKASTPELMVTPEQRIHMIHTIRRWRETYPIFAMDFQNDGQYVGGCIAAGRRYLHINAKGDVEPCVFIHYSNCNIHDVSLLDALKSPIFMAYHDGQPFNGDHLRPCPMLENSGRLTEMVKATGAVNTDYQDPESAEELCAKTEEYAKAWAPVAEELWKEDQDWRAAKKEAVANGQPVPDYPLD
ncbi:MAG: radical SAM protein [Eubacterium sp.]|nr:radical SAM protein [Eubacterium sp.]